MRCALYFFSSRIQAIMKDLDELESKHGTLKEAENVLCNGSPSSPSSPDLFSALHSLCPCPLLLLQSYHCVLIYRTLQFSNLHLVCCFPVVFVAHGGLVL